MDSALHAMEAEGRGAIAPHRSRFAILRIVTPLSTELSGIVGARHVLERATALLVDENDALPVYHKRPRLAGFPGTRDEVIAVVRARHRARVPFVPRGAGTGLSGGALADDIVLIDRKSTRLNSSHL